MKIDIYKSLKAVTTLMQKEAPNILTALAVVTEIGAIGLAIVSTRKNDAELKECETTKEKVITTAKNYAGVAGMLAVSVTCNVCSRRESAKREAVIAAAYKLSEETFKTYREKVKEISGEEGDRNVRSRIAQDKINSNPPTDENVTYTGDGNTLFYDALSGRYFRSDIQTVRGYENDLHREVLESTYVTVNDWYYMIGLDDIEFGKDNGWDFSHPMHLIFGSKLTPNKEPCVILDYAELPSPKYLGIF